jgi:hypothetical protein
MSLRKRKDVNDTVDKQSKKHRTVNKGVNLFIPLNKLDLSDNTSDEPAEKTYSQSEVTALLAKQQQEFRCLLEDKLREQFTMFNQFYINNIFKEYEKNDCSYII